MIYSKTKDYTLYKGKMQEVLDTLEENSIDSIVCDPPYELNFMGKGWDNQGIAFQPDTWKHCYRVLKDGGYLLAFGSSRTFHRIACAIEDAGFEIRDTIMWLYGSGFPKSMDISKQIDKKGGNNYSIEFAEDLKKARISRNLTMKYCDDKYCNGSTNWSWYEGRIAGVRVPDYETYLEIVKDFPELEKYRELIKEAEREVIGTINRTKGVAIPACGEKIDRSSYAYKITTATTDLAKKYQGWGTCLKPAYEPIIVARKPFKGSLVDNVIENGVGGINIDECRIAFENTPNPATNPLYRKQNNYKLPEKGQQSNGAVNFTSSKNEVNEQGRFPANVILTYDETDFEEVCGGMPDTKSNIEIPNQKHTFKGNKDAFQYGYKMRYGSGFNDEGNASRYFYCAKASKKDRDEGLDLFEEKTSGELTERQEGSAGISPYACSRTPKKNIHPTVKPVELMQYLVRLVSPKGSTILDCFMGSGSTGKAVMFENIERNANYHFIGVEMTEEYLPICESRIDYALNKYEYDLAKQTQELKEKGIQTIFDFME